LAQRRQAAQQVFAATEVKARRGLVEQQHLGLGIIARAICTRLRSPSDRWKTGA